MEQAKQEREAADLKAYIRDRNWDYRTKLLAIFGYEREGSRKEPERSTIRDELKRTWAADSGNYFLKWVMAPDLNDHFLQVRAKLFDEVRTNGDRPLSPDRAASLIRLHCLKIVMRQKNPKERHHLYDSVHHIEGLVIYFQLWTGVFGYAAPCRMMNQMAQQDSRQLRWWQAPHGPPSGAAWISDIARIAKNTYLPSPGDHDPIEYTKFKVPEYEPDRFVDGLPRFLCQTEATVRRHWIELELLKRMRDTYREEARHNKAYGVQLTSPEQIHFSQNDMYQEESFEEPIVTSYGTYNRSRVILPHNEFSNASLCDTPDFLGIPRSTWIASQGPNANGRSELDRDATTYTNPGPRWFPKDDRTYHFAINLLLPPKSSQDYTCKKLVGQVIQLAALTGTRASRPLAEWIPKKVDETILIRKARGTDLDTIYITLLSFSCTSSDPTKGWEESKVRIVGRINGKLVVNVFWLFYLRTWADFGVPSNTKEFAEFILRVHSGPGCDRPKLVHCAAGVGRTGAFITIASLVDLLAFFFRSPIVAEQLLEAFATRAKRRGSQLPAPLLRDPIAFTVNFLRDYRSGMVQRENQFKDLYQVARELFAKWNEDPRLAPVPKTWLSVHG